MKEFYSINNRELFVLERLLKMLYNNKAFYIIRSTYIILNYNIGQYVKNKTIKNCPCIFSKDKFYTNNIHLICLV